MPPPLPLAGRRVVVTRPADQAGPLADALRALGAEPILVPAVQVAPADADALARAASGLAGAAWVVVTSISGVRFAWPHVEAAWPDGLPDRLRVAAIGPGAAAAVEARGVPVSFVPGRSLVPDLVDGLPVELGDRVVLFRAASARDALPDGLRQRGATVEDVPAYHATERADSDALDDAFVLGPDAVLFTAGSTVRGILAALGGPDRLAAPGAPRLVAIGPVTAGWLTRAGLPVHAVADEPTLNGLLSATARLLA